MDDSIIPSVRDRVKVELAMKDAGDAVSSEKGNHDPAHS
jgi:hypothetical protein